MVTSDEGKAFAAAQWEHFQQPQAAFRAAAQRLPSAECPTERPSQPANEGTTYDDPKHRRQVCHDRSPSFPRPLSRFDQFGDANAEAFAEDDNDFAFGDKATGDIDVYRLTDLPKS